jgi:hypothetical protein
MVSDMVSDIEQAGFDSKTTEILREAFYAAWEILEAAGGPIVEQGNAASTRALIAKHIIDMARSGERDLNNLIYGALDRVADSGPNGAQETR